MTTYLTERLPPLKICNFQEHQIKNLCYLSNTINIQGNKNNNNNNIINNNSNNNDKNNNNNLIVINLVFDIDKLSFSFNFNIN